MVSRARFGRLWGSGPLSRGPFRLLVAGQLTSSIGDLCYAVALPWLILSGDGGTVLLGAVLAVYGISRAVAIPVGGVVTDRVGPRVLMLGTDVIRFVTVGLLGLLALSEVPSFAVLAPIAFVLGACGGLFMPASFAVVPSILPDRELTSGNALSSMATQLGSLLGPTLGGVLVATIGPGPAFLVDSGTFAVSALTLLLMQRSLRASAVDADGAEALADEPGAPTFRDVLRRGRLLHVIMGTAMVGNLVYAGTAEVALPALAYDDFGAGGYSALLVGLGAGLIIGAALAHRDWLGNRPVVPLVVFGLVMAASIALLPFAGGLIGAIACITVFSVANSWSGVVVITMLQVWTPRALLGRTMSLLMLAMTGTFPLAVAVTGLTVNRVGVTTFFLVAGAAMSAAVLSALAQPALRNYRSGDRFTIVRSTVHPDPAAEAARVVALDDERRTTS